MTQIAEILEDGDAQPMQPYGISEVLEDGDLHQLSAGSDPLSLNAPGGLPDPYQPGAVLRNPAMAHSVVDTGAVAGSQIYPKSDPGYQPKVPTSAFGDTVQDLTMGPLRWSGELAGSALKAGGVYANDPSMFEAGKSVQEGANAVFPPSSSTIQDPNSVRTHLVHGGPQMGMDIAAAAATGTGPAGFAALGAMRGGGDSFEANLEHARSQGVPEDEAHRRATLASELQGAATAALMGLNPFARLSGAVGRGAGNVIDRGATAFTEATALAGLQGAADKSIQAGAIEHRAPTGNELESAAMTSMTQQAPLNALFAGASPLMHGSARPDAERYQTGNRPRRPQAPAPEALPPDIVPVPPQAAPESQPGPAVPGRPVEGGYPPGVVPRGFVSEGAMGSKGPKPILSVESRVQPGEDIPGQPEHVESRYRLVAGPDGTPDFGRIDQQVANEAGIESAPIRMQRGDGNFGLTHLIERRGEDLKRLGFASPIDFVKDVATDFDELWRRPSGEVQIVKRTQQSGLLSVDLYPQHGGYVVITAYPMSNVRRLKGSTLLWARSAGGEGEASTAVPPDTGPSGPEIDRAGPDVLRTTQGTAAGRSGAAEPTNPTIGPKPGGVNPNPPESRVAPVSVPSGAQRRVTVQGYPENESPATVLEGDALDQALSSLPKHVRNGVESGRKLVMTATGRALLVNEGQISDLRPVEQPAERDWTATRSQLEKMRDEASARADQQHAGDEAFPSAADSPDVQRISQAIEAIDLAGKQAGILAGSPQLKVEEIRNAMVDELLPQQGRSGTDGIENALKKANGGKLPESVKWFVVDPDGEEIPTVSNEQGMRDAFADAGLSDEQATVYANKVREARKRQAAHDNDVITILSRLDSGAKETISTKLSPEQQSTIDAAVKAGVLSATPGPKGTTYQRIGNMAEWMATRSAPQPETPAAPQTPLTLAELTSVTFDQMPSEGETEGVAGNRGKKYRTGEFVAIDDAGSERRYRVRVSSDGKRTVEDLGKTREQSQRDTQAEYDALEPATRDAIDSLGFDIKWIGNKTLIGETMEGKKPLKRLGLIAALQNQGVAEKFQEKFPGIDNIDDAAKALREYLKSHKRNAPPAQSEVATPTTPTNEVSDGKAQEAAQAEVLNPAPSEPVTPAPEQPPARAAKPVKKPPGTFTKSGLKDYLLGEYNRSDEGADAQAVNRERMMEESGGGAAGLVFHRDFPGEIKRMMDERPEIRRLLSLTDDRTKSHGADLLGEIGVDKYERMLEDMLGNRDAELSAAIDHAKHGNNPDTAFRAAVYEAIDNYEGEKNPTLQNHDPKTLPTGTKGTIMGHQVEIIEDADGYRILKDGEDFPAVPVDALEKLPIDKGTLQKGKPEESPKVSEDHVDEAGDVPDFAADVAADAKAPPPPIGALDKIEQWAERRIADRAKSKTQATKDLTPRQRRQRGSAGSLDPQELFDRTLIGLVKLGKKVPRFNDWVKVMLKRFPDMALERWLNGKRVADTANNDLRKIWRTARRVFAMNEEGRADWMNEQYTIPEQGTIKQQIARNVDRGTIEKSVREMDVLGIRLRAMAQGERTGFKLGETSQKNRQLSSEQGKTEIPLKAVIQGQIKVREQGRKLGWKQGIDNARGISEELSRIVRETLPAGEREPMLRQIAGAATLGELNVGVRRLRNVLADYDVKNALADVEKLTGRMRLDVADRPVREKPDLTEAEEAESLGKKQVAAINRRAMREIDLNRIEPKWRDMQIDGHSIKSLIADARVAKAALSNVKTIDDKYRAVGQFRQIFNLLRERVIMHDMEQTTRIGSDKATVQQKRAQIIERLGKRTQLKQPDPKLGEDPVERGLPRRWATMRSATPETIMLDIDGQWNGDGGPASEPIVRDTRRALNEKQGEIGRFDDARAEAMKSAGYPIGTRKWTDFVANRENVTLPDAGDVGLTRSEMLGLYSMWRDPETRAMIERNGKAKFNHDRDRAANPFEFTPRDFDVVAEKLTDAEKAIKDDFFDSYNKGKLRDRAIEAKYRLSGFAPEPHDGYFPRRINPDKTPIAGEPLSMRAAKRALENVSQMEERSNHGQTFIVPDFLRDTNRFISDTANLVHMAEPTRIVRMLIEHPDTKGALRNRYGPKMIDELDKFLLNLSESPDPPTWDRGFANAINRQIYRAMLPLNPRTFVNNALGGTQSLFPMFDARDFAAGLKAIASPSAHKEMVEASHIVSSRWSNPLHEQYGSFVRTEKSSLPRLAIGEALASVKDSALKGDLRRVFVDLGRAADAVTLMNVADSAPFRVAWAATKSEIARTHPELKGEELRQRTLDRFHDAVMRTQNGLTPTETSGLWYDSRSSLVLKGLTFLKNDVNKKLNVILQSKHADAATKLKVATSILGNAATGMSTRVLFTGTALGLILRSMIRGKEPDKDEIKTHKQRALSYAVDSASGLIPGGDIVTSMLESITTGRPFKFDSLPAFRPLEDLGAGAVAGARATQEKNDKKQAVKYRSALYKITNALRTLAGDPTLPVTRDIVNAIDAYNGPMKH